jgi:large subunit ribosomal protein L9
MATSLAAAVTSLGRRAFVRPRPPAVPPVRTGKRVQVVLKQPFDELGFSGQEVAVAPGYARNYLIPKGIAAYATPENRATHRVEVDPERARALDAERVQRLLRARVARYTLPLYRASRDGVALYSSISAEDLVVRLNETPLRSFGVKQANMRVVRDGAPRPLREGDIATVGEHAVEIEMARSMPGLWCPLKVVVLEA